MLLMRNIASRHRARAGGRKKGRGCSHGFPGQEKVIRRRYRGRNTTSYLSRARARAADVRGNAAVLLHCAVRCAVRCAALQQRRRRTSATLRDETILCIKQKARNTISRELHALTFRAYFRRVVHLEAWKPYRDAPTDCSLCDA